MEIMKLLFILHNFLDPSVTSVLCANILLSTQFFNTASVLPLRAVSATTHSSHNASNEVPPCTNVKELCDVHLTAEGLVNTQIRRGISVAGKIFLEFKCIALMSVPANDLCYFRILSLSKSGAYKSLQNRGRLGDRNLFCLSAREKTHDGKPPSALSRLVKASVF